MARKYGNDVLSKVHDLNTDLVGDLINKDGLTPVEATTMVFAATLEVDPDLAYDLGEWLTEGKPGAGEHIPEYHI